MALKFHFRCIGSILFGSVSDPEDFFMDPYPDFTDPDSDTDPLNVTELLINKIM
jgi:hypothetical protein